MVAIAETSSTHGAGSVRPRVLAEFRKHSGSTFGGLFGAAAFDEVALAGGGSRGQDRSLRRQLRRSRCAQRVFGLPGHLGRRRGSGCRGRSAQVDAPGGPRPGYRGLRRREVQRPGSATVELDRGQRNVHGAQLLHALYGDVLSDAERELAYAQLLDAFRALELPGKNAKLPATYAEAADYYETMVRDELQANTFLQRVTIDLTRLPLPTVVLPPTLRRMLTPPWLVLRPVAGHVVKVCSFGILHPGIREMTGFRWESRHDREFALYCRVLQLAWRVLPDKLLLIPLARNRIEYEKLVRVHRSVALDSFAPPPGCPAG